MFLFLSTCSSYNYSDINANRYSFTETESIEPYSKQYVHTPRQPTASISRAAAGGAATARQARPGSQHRDDPCGRCRGDRPGHPGHRHRQPNRGTGEFELSTTSDHNNTNLLVITQYLQLLKLAGGTVEMIHTGLKGVELRNILAQRVSDDFTFQYFDRSLLVKIESNLVSFLLLYTIRLFK